MAEITLMKTPAEAGIAQNFEALKALLPGDAAARESAFRRFSERGLPHRRVEAFKYTDLRAAVREAAPFVERLDAAALRDVAQAAVAFAEVDALRLTIVNGHLSREESGLAEVAAGLEAEYPAPVRHLAAFATGDAAELAAKLNELLALPAETHRALADAARRAVVARWSWASVAGRILERFH